MSAINLDALFELPGDYKELGDYTVNMDDIKGLGVLPPYRPVGFNRKVETIPYITMYDGRNIKLPDVPHNHEAIQSLAEMFVANELLYNYENRPEDVKLSKEDKKVMTELKKFISEFEELYVVDAPAAFLSMKFS